MTRCLSEPKSHRRLLRTTVGLAVALTGLLSDAAYADEDGVSYWLPGRFSSLAAVPAAPGWSMAEVYYHTSVSAFGNVAAAREIRIGRIPANVNVDLNLHLNAQADLVLLNPAYTFATPVLGGQLAIGITGVFGRSAASLDGMLTTAVGPFVTTRTGTLSDSITSVGDLYPQATLKWNAGVHNFMTYLTGDIPVGAYSPTRLANLGIGHGAIDGGGGYTYFNPQSGHEFSAVAGFTYNFKNPDTQYQNGIDFHIDWGASQFLSKQFFVVMMGRDQHNTVAPEFYSDDDNAEDRTVARVVLRSCQRSSRRGAAVQSKAPMAMGMPVVSTLHSGIPELVEDGVSGLLVPERDVAAVAGALEYLIEHPEIREEMGRAGRESIKIQETVLERKAPE